jgi:DNA ligase 1
MDKCNQMHHYPLVLQVLDKFQDKPFTCEYKYDGERAQVHILEGELTNIMGTRIT